MAGGKVFLTYKRKRSLSRDDIPQEDGYPDSSAEYESYKASNISNNHEELAEGNNSVNSGEDSEHGLKGKRPFSGCVEQQDCVVSAQESRRVVEKTMHEQVISNLHILPEGAPAEGTGEKASGNQLFSSLHSKGKSYGTQKGSCSSVDPSLACGDISTENYSALPSVKLNIVSEPDLLSMKSSMKGNHSHEYIATNALEERSGLLIEHKSRRWPINTLRRRLTSPLITFSRRTKQKKDDNPLQAQNTLPLGDNRSLPFEGCKPTAAVRTCEATSPKNCALQASENLSPSEKNITSGRSFNSCQEITSKDVNNSSACPGSVPEIGSSKQAEEKLGNTSKDNPSTSEVLQDSGSNRSSLQSKIGGDFRETPIVTGNSSIDATDEPSHEPVLPACHEPMDKKSQSSSNGGMKTTRISKENLCDRNTQASLDLSVPPPDSPISLDCNVAVEVDLEEQSVHSLSETRSGNPTALSSEVPVIDKGLESMQERIRDKQSAHLAEKLDNGSSTQEAAGAKYNNSVNSSPILALKDNCLQLFPEGRAHGKSLGKAIVCSDSGGTAFGVLPSTSHGRIAEAKSSEVLPLSLPMEPMVDSRAGSSTIPQWPNLGIQSRGLSQDGMPSANQTLRQKMMIDSIASGSRGVGGNRSSFFDRFDFPTTWSEDELDCLWIGVRRYGRGNWDAMLRDPKLHFFPYRTPRHLAEQWEVEHSKLYSGSPPFPPARPMGRPNALPDSTDGLRQPRAGKQNSVSDVQLSLGDAYSQQRDNFQKRPLFNYMNTQSNAARQIQNPVVNTRTIYPLNGAHRRTMPENHPKSDVGPSVSSKATTSTDAKLPHWLKEAVAVLPRPPPPDTTLPSSNTNGTQRESRNTVSNYRIPDSIELLGAANRNARDSRPSAAGRENAEGRENNVGRQNLILINSDASSEETISDDRGGRA